MNVLNAIEARRSYRGKFKSVSVPREDLIKIMKAGLAVPSGCNKQTGSLLAIVELGYQSCWYEGHITDDDKICDEMAKILDVPDNYNLVCFLPIGVAEEKPITPQKKAFEDRTWFNKFGGRSLNS